MIGFSVCFPLQFFSAGKGGKTFNGNDSKRSETDFEIHSCVQRRLSECALVTEAVKPLDTGEGTIRRIFILSMHFDNLIFFTQ